MQALLALVVVAFGLAAAAPSDNLEGSLLKRDNTLCNLGNYPTATKGPIYDAINALNNAPDTAEVCTPVNGCARVSCTFGTSVAICTGPNTQTCVKKNTIGNEVYVAYEDCGGDPSKKGSGSFPAFQRFLSNYNILVKGTGAGVKC